MCLCLDKRQGRLPGPFLPSLGWGAALTPCSWPRGCSPCVVSPLVLQSWHGAAHVVCLCFKLYWCYMSCLETAGGMCGLDRGVPVCRGPGALAGSPDGMDAVPDAARGPVGWEDGVGCACLRFRSAPCKLVIQDPNTGSIKNLPDPHRAGFKPSGAG